MVGAENGSVEIYICKRGCVESVRGEGLSFYWCLVGVNMV